MGNIQPRGVRAKYWQRDRKRERESKGERGRMRETESEGSCNLVWILMSGPGIASSGGWKMCRRSIRYFLPWLFDLCLCFSLSSSARLPSLSTLISPYIFITPPSPPPPSLPLQLSSHLLLFWPPFLLQQLFSRHWQCGAWVTVQELCRHVLGN